MCNHGRGELASNGFGKEARLLEEDGKLFQETRTHPGFVEFLLRMIDELPDDIVSWSVAGDSFVIKQVSAFEGALPSYYSHGNFMSFVRQLNNYGFQRIKRTPSSSLGFTVDGKDGAAAAAAASVATVRASPWEEFSHPMCRRGRPDLLVGIHRHKNGACLRPKAAYTEELSMLTSLQADVGALSGDLRTVNGKLENIISLLSDVARSQNHPAPNNTNRVAVGVAGSGSSGFEGGNDIGSAAVPAKDAHGGRVGFEGWIGGGGRKSEGGIGRESHDAGVVGAPPGHFMGRYVPVAHQQHGAGNQHVFYLPPPRMPSSTQQHPAGPHRARYDEALPPLAEAVAACAPGSASAGTLCQTVTTIAPTCSAPR